MGVRILLTIFVILFAVDINAQQLAPQPKEPAPEQTEEKPKPKAPDTRQAAFTSGGDSAAGSIGGIKTPESTKVSSGGAATQSIPIVVPPGTAGVQPRLSFNYSSQGENSLLGVGWSVGGLPVIHRCPRTVAQDGFRGAINYDLNDRYCLDGQRLMMISGSFYGADNAEYRTEVDSFLKIKSFGAAGNGPAHFKVWTKGGELMEFGNSINSAIEAEGKASIRVWALNKLQDVKGNYLTVTYAEDSANGEYRPTQIDYTANTGLTVNRKVVFGYNEGGVVRADQIPQWVGGSKILTTKLLTSVKTYAPPPGGGTPVLVRDYRLEYETGTATTRSRLKRIKECDANGNCLPANTPTSQPAWQFTWQEGGNGTWDKVSYGVTDPGFNANTTTEGDFNGDGKSDIISVDEGKVYTYLSNGDGTYQRVTFNPAANQLDAYFWPGDLDGDGRTDFVTAKNDKLYTYISLGDGTYELKTIFSYNGSLFNPNYVWPGDVDGDGRADLITYENAKLITYRSHGDGNYTVWQHTINASQFNRDRTRLGDFNGDGKADLFSKVSNTGHTYLSVGDGAFQRVGQTVNLYDLSILAGDFNGDGKTDIAGFELNQTTGERFIRTHFSKGDGTYQIVSYLVPANIGVYVYDYQYVGDFNGDGKADILGTNVWDEASGPYYTYTFFSKGDGNFSVIQELLADFFQTIYQAWIGDFKGEGKSSFLRSYNWTWRTHSYVGPYPDLLTNIINPFAGQTTVTYKPLTDDTVYTKDSGAQAAVYPKMDHQYPLYVVSDITVNDGLGTEYDYNYAYGGAKAHHLGRGGLGFRWMAEVDISANAKTTTFYKQDFPHTGLPDTVETDRNSDGAPFRDTIHEYWNQNAYPSSPTISFVAPKKVDIIEADGSGSSNRTLRREFTYDSPANGNLASVYHHGDVAVSGDEREEVTEWIAVDPSVWLHRAKTLKLKDGGGNTVREKWLYYDGQAHGVLNGPGLVTKEETNAGGGIGNGSNPVFTYTYDATTGVRTSVRDPRNCDTTTVYESTKTFPQTITTCANVPSLNFPMAYVYDPRFGVKTSETDWNSQTTTYNYDLFGRLTKVTGPLDTGSTYGTVSHLYSDWGNPSLQRVITYRTEEHGTGNVLWSEEFFDGLGRIDKTRNEGPDASTTIVVDMLFDSRNLMTQQSAPHYANETPKYTNFTYDPLGRATRVDHPDSNFATKSYAQGVVTLTDERGKIKKRHFDGLEQLTKVEEFNSSETYTTTYARDAAGALKTVTNQLGHLTRIDYDMAGRKRAMCDPNMGTPSNVSSCTTATAGAWVYTYNQAGDLLTQKDAKNQQLDFTYDELGRPKTKKQGANSLVTWTYDDPTVLFSKGRVTRVVDLSTTTNFAYDALGQVTQSQRTLLGVPYTMAQTYDALGRIKTETFPAPDNETVTYTYDNAGRLKTVPGYINDIQYDARGQKTLVTYANSLTTTSTFDPNRFWIATRVTSSNQQNLTYVHDPVGNITSIADTLFTASRTFTYDDLNRLLTASGTFGSGQSQQNCTYGYNAIGNIVNKCGVTYSYNDAMHPSAVTSISSGKSYTYDANGNMLTRGVQTIAWDIDNRVTSVSIAGGGSTSMEYDFTGMRVKKNALGGITLYPFKGFEIDPSGTITKFIKIGNESFASKKGANKYFYHNDHLGGVNVITDISGTRVQLNEYEPWGGVSRSEGTIDPTHRFTGQELDPETGLYYYGGRYFDAEIGRFISPDPYVQAPDEPQNLNRYSYTLNNPVNLTDPTGHFFWIPAIISFVIEAIAAILPELFIVDGVLTTVGTVATATQAALTLAQVGMLSAQLQKQAELSNLNKNRGVEAQQQNNIQQTRPGVKREDPWPMNNLGNGNDGFRGFNRGDDTVDLPLDMLLYARWLPRGLFRTPPPPAGQPKPPGWTPEWRWQYPENTTKPTSPRYYDPTGGEWRWHPPDKWHPQGHWDYNPWDQWNSPWRNVPPTGGTLPSMPPNHPPYRVPDLMPDPWA